MKPSILHVLIDRNVGGVTASVNSLLRSRLAEKFNFLLLTPQEAFSKASKLTKFASFLVFLIKSFPFGFKTRLK